MEWSLLVVVRVRYQEQLVVQAVEQQLLLVMLQQFPTQALLLLVLTQLVMVQVVAQVLLAVLVFHQVAAQVRQLTLEL
jgi:hypothetical protein